jgi:hypothetical protein
VSVCRAGAAACRELVTGWTFGRMPCVSGPGQTSEARRSVAESVLAPIAVIGLAAVAAIIWHWLARLSNPVMAWMSVVAAFLCLIPLWWLLWVRPTSVWRQRLRVAVACLSAITTISAVIGILIGPGPSAEISWYLTDEAGQLRLTQNSNLEVSPPSSVPDQLLIPMNLAVRDIGDKPLRNVTVQIRYPAGYSLIPQGDQVIDPDNRTVIYEHPLKDVKVSGGAAFLPTSATDHLAFRAATIEDFSVALTADNVPEDLYSRIVTYVGTHKVDSIHIPTLPIDLQVRLFADGRPIGRRNLSVTVPGLIQYGFQTPDGPLANWRSRFDPYRALVSGSQKWQLRGEPLQRTTGQTAEIEYRAGRTSKARYQVIGVNGQPRRIIVDENGDGKRDMEFVDLNGDGTFDGAGSYRSPVGLYPWTPEILR